jgi:DNA polymerase-3 subunit gamma/tau
LTEELGAGVGLIAFGDRAEVAVVVAAQVPEVVATPDAGRGLDLSASASLYSAESLQRAAVDALSAAKNQDTPADALDAAEWTVTEGEVRVQTDLSKTMLPMVVNGEAEKLVKNALREAGAGAIKLVQVLITKSRAAGGQQREEAKSGSARGDGHPIVQRAQTLFNAEIRA